MTRIKKNWLLAVGLTVTIGFSGTAFGQQLTGLYVSNALDDWDSNQEVFNPAQQIAVYGIFPTASHAGFHFSATCVVSLQATRHELARVAISPVYINPGVDLVRTDPFYMAWPNANIDITCVPDSNPAGAYSIVMEPSWWTASTNTGTTPPAVAYPPQPPTTVTHPPVAHPPVAHPPVVHPPVAHPPAVLRPPAEPEPPADCRSTLLGMGHSATNLMFCDGVPRACAVALLEAGHSPTDLMFCDGVSEQCAIQLLQSGGSPTELMFCD